MAIHSDQVSRYGGQPGIRDMGLLESAMAQPQASFGGDLLHKDLFEMAGSYAFHIAQNHPFFDGNKRTALAAALVFLHMNEVRVRDPQSTLMGVMYDVAQGKIEKPRLAGILKDLASEHS